MNQRAPRLVPSRRQSQLAETQQLKMARSAHAYVRGNTLKFYAWLKTASVGAVPKGPPVWICGDCHLGNLGPVISEDGQVEVEIRDLDQTVIGNPAHDLIRLALSLATAVRGSDLPGVTTARLLEQMMDGYEEGFAHPSRRQKKSDLASPIQRVLRESLKRQWKHLASERIEDARPTIPIGDSFWPLSKAEKREIKRIFRTKEVQEVVTALPDRKKGAKVKVLDAAYWVKGCSSLGRLRYAVLLGIGKRGHKHERFGLFDIKEAVKAAAPKSPRARMPANNAKRVVEGARNLSPFLGQRMLPEAFFGAPVVVRELAPQDLKLEMRRLTAEDATMAARFLATVVGKAHARQMDVATREKWLGELQRNRAKDLDAPSWLWSAVVELIAMHEVAYLEHCRKYDALVATRRATPSRRRRR